MLIIAMTSMVLTGCQKQDTVTEIPTPAPAPEPEKNYVLADLALSLPASPSGTRLSGDVVQLGEGAFRGISKLSFIPFTTQGKIQLDDKPSYFESNNSYLDLNTTPQNAIPANERWLYYDKFYLMRGVASFLLYGQASQKPDIPSPLPLALPSYLTDDMRRKAFYGSLIANIEGVKTAGIPQAGHFAPSTLTFEPEPIYSQTAEPEEATLLGLYLTWIAEAEFGNFRWKDLEDSETNANQRWLHNLFESFVNKDITVENSEEYNVLAGSAANVRAYVKELYAKLQDKLSSSDLENNSNEKGLVDNIVYRITHYSKDFGNRNLTINFDSNTGDITLGGCDNYPRNLGLPDGAAVLLWAQNNNGGYEFIPQTETTTMANICSMDRYAYPVELYYRANSTIKTSNTALTSTDYAGKTAWSGGEENKNVLDLYKSGTAVTSNTKAVAVVDPMQYAVANFCANLRAESSTLKDRDGDNVTIGEQSFPVTGIIVSGQNPVGFDFVPETADTGEDQEYFVYDHYLNDGQPLYLTATETTNNPIQTLLLQTKNQEDISVILELENNSDKDFKGESGVVYRGTKFYLVGKLSLKNLNLTGAEDYKKRIFTQDHTSEVTMVVKTLANAFNVMPNVQSERLKVSVEMNLKWIQAEPGSIEFEKYDR